MKRKRNLQAIIQRPNREAAIQEFWERRTKLVNKKLSSFPTSYMSNAKWRKLFLALYTKEDLIKGYRWNFVEGEVYPSPEISSVLQPDDISAQGTADGFGFPVAMPYREIESIVVLTDRPMEIIEFLETVGRFKLIPCPQGFQVIGYE